MLIFHICLFLPIQNVHIGIIYFKKRSPSTIECINKLVNEYNMQYLYKIQNHVKVNNILFNDIYTDGKNKMKN